MFGEWERRNGWMKLVYSRSRPGANVNIDFMALSLQCPLLSNLFMFDWCPESRCGDAGRSIIYWFLNHSNLNLKGILRTFFPHCWINHLHAKSEGMNYMWSKCAHSNYCMHRYFLLMYIKSQNFQVRESILNL